MAESASVVNETTWNAYDNELVSIMRPEEENDRLSTFQFSGDNFLLDYLGACAILRIQPHPQIIRPDHPLRVVKEEDKTKKPIEKVRGKSNKSAAKEKQLASEKDLKDKYGDYDPDAPIESVSINGWVLDMATARALSATLIHCRTITQFKLWSAQVRGTVIKRVADMVHSSSVQRFSLDFNPLDTTRDTALEEKLLEAKAQAEAEEAADKEVQLAIVSEEDDELNSARSNEEENAIEAAAAAAALEAKAALAKDAGKKSARKEKSKNKKTPQSGKRSSRKGLDENKAEEAPAVIISPFTYFVMAPSTSNLQLLSLRANAIDDEVGTQLFQALKDNKTLLSINLWNNQLTDKIVPVMKEVLLLNKTLVALSVAKNNFTDEGAIEIASIFRCEVIDKEESKKMKKDGFSITVGKNKCFRDAQQTLRNLNLSGNNIGDAGCTALLGVLGDDMGSRPIQVEDQRASKKRLKDPAKEAHGRPNRLEWVSLKGNNYSEQLAEKLAKDGKIELEDKYMRSEEPEEKQAEEGEQKEAPENGHLYD